MFARFVRLPEWLAWDTFEIKNGCPTLDAMKDRIAGMRERIDYHAPRPSNEIGCILLAQPTFFAPNDWIPGARGLASSEPAPQEIRSSGR
jgi:hypothetical protein